MGSAHGNNTGSGYWRVYIEWSGGENGDPRYYNISVSAYRYAVKKDTSGYDARKDTTTITIDGASASGKPTWNHANTAGQTRYLWGWTRAVAKTHSGRYAGLSCTNSHPSGTMGGSSTASGSEYVPPLPSYAVKYDGNSSDTAVIDVPEDQTKWYGETLSLASTIPSKPNHEFLGWNTEPDGSGTDYAPEDSYTGNQALTLYAQWKLAATTVRLKIDGNWQTIPINLKAEPNSFEEEDGVLVPVNGGWIKPTHGYVKVEDEWCQLI